MSEHHNHAHHISLLRAQKYSDILYLDMCLCESEWQNWAGAKLCCQWSRIRDIVMLKSLIISYIKTAPWKTLLGLSHNSSNSTLKNGEHPTHYLLTSKSVKLYSWRLWSTAMCSCHVRIERYLSRSTHEKTWNSTNMTNLEQYKNERKNFTCKNISSQQKAFHKWPGPMEIFLIQV